MVQYLSSQPFLDRSFLVERKEFFTLFLRKDLTVVMAFRQCFFLDTPEVTNIVLPKVLPILRYYKIVPVGPGN